MATSKPGYTGHYNPRTNPNSAMLRVLHNAGYDNREITPSMVGSSSPDHDDGRGIPVRFEVDEVNGALTREAAKAGYALVEVLPIDEDTVQVLFRVV